MVDASGKREFGEILLEAIDEAFLTLGENTKASLYNHLETKFSIPKEEIPQKIEAFSDALEKIFGQAARQIEILIMKHLNQKVNCSYEWIGPKWLVPNLTFTSYLSMVRRFVEKSESSEPEAILAEETEDEQTA